ncbi:alpha/beta hydrolase fold domain-containing protein [Dietzia psychralcaliphila]|uniref:alpha/beta hydrolase fold domain-containing protein n=1 Tax=Dietzia psychralcaliphila TaxID=139021 RepID=UPI001C1E7B1C|nr:alpha/beta hydrolase [Dietzia psychralcaliphila]
MTTRTHVAVTTHRDVDLLSRLLYWGGRATLRQVYRFWPTTDAGIRGMAAVERGFARLSAPAGVRVARTVLGGTAAETTTPESVGPDALDDVTVLYLHGGAFVFCGPGTHRQLCGQLAVALGATVHSLDYRMLPDVDLATVVDDAYAGYRALSEQLPADHRIVVAGDSAGGYLAAAICELTARDGIRPPAAMVGYSPLLDVDGAMREGPWATRDSYQPAVTVARFQRLWQDHADGLESSRSMLTSDPTVFPPTLITLAAGELVEPAALRVTEHLHAAGRQVETHRWHSAVHAFPVLAGLTPHSRHAGRITAEFLRRTLTAPLLDHPQLACPRDGGGP